MRDVANPDIALRRCNDLARLYAAATLNQLAVEPGLLEVTDPVRNELRLIDGNCDRIDHPAACVLGPSFPGSHRNATARDDGECGTSGHISHQACSLSLPATLSSAFSTASPISTVESLFAPG